MATAGIEARKQPRTRRVPSSELNVSFQNRLGSYVTVKAKLLDVSDSGAGVELSTPLTVGAAVELGSDVGSGTNRRQVRTQGRVTWCASVEHGGAFRAGVCFLEPGSGAKFEPQGKSGTARPSGAPDYYEILQLSPKADADTIHRVFRLLAQRYHPDNQDTGHAERFRQITEAYRVLSDPELRAGYDVQSTMDRQLRWRIFEQPTSTEGVEAEKRKRQGILALLYTQRSRQPEQPAVSLHEMEDLLGCPREHLEFSLWYLKESGCVTRGDNGRYAITVKGVDHAETSNAWPMPSSRLIPASPAQST